MSLGLQRSVVVEAITPYRAVIVAAKALYTTLIVAVSVLGIEQLVDR